MGPWECDLGAWALKDIPVAMCLHLMMAMGVPGSHQQ
jgi:hypothetical protein